MERHVLALRVAPILAGAICAALSLNAARADVGAPETTRPAPVPGSGNWWDTNEPPTMPDPRLAPQPPMPRPYAPTPYGSSVTDYPGSQMNEWVSASAMAARARAMRERAQSELNQTIHRVQVRFEHSEEYTRAAIAERQAYTAYVAARQQVIVSLFGDPKYHAIMQLRDEVGEKIASRRFARADAENIDLWLASRGFERTKLTGEQMITLKAMFEAEQSKAAKSDDAPQDDLLALATLKMQYASDARVIEVSALSADENLKSAHDKMVDASKHLSELKAQFDYALHDNPEILFARRNLEDAKIAVIEAQALACSASIASSYALNYSYYLHRNDNGGVYGPYGQTGSPVGYSTPYWGR